MAASGHIPMAANTRNRRNAAEPSTDCQASSVFKRSRTSPLGNRVKSFRTSSSPAARRPERPAYGPPPAAPSGSLWAARPAPGRRYAEAPGKTEAFHGGSQLARLEPDQDLPEPAAGEGCRSVRGRPQASTAVRVASDGRKRPPLTPEPARPSGKAEGRKVPARPVPAAIADHLTRAGEYRSEVQQREQPRPSPGPGERSPHLNDPSGTGTRKVRTAGAGAAPARLSPGGIELSFRTCGQPPDHGRRRHPDLGDAVDGRK
jgi:hypothetical protein